MQLLYQKLNAKTIPFLQCNFYTMSALHISCHFYNAKIIPKITSIFHAKNYMQSLCQKLYAISIPITQCNIYAIITMQYSYRKIYAIIMPA